MSNMYHMYYNRADINSANESYVQDIGYITKVPDDKGDESHISFVLTHYWESLIEKEFRPNMTLDDFVGSIKAGRRVVMDCKRGLTVTFTPTSISEGAAMIRVFHPLAGKVLEADITRFEQKPLSLLEFYGDKAKKRAEAYINKLKEEENE